MSPVQGAGRVDNPAHYRVLYASDCATGAVAEAFGNHDQWTDQLLAGRPDLPGSRTALAEFEAHDLAALDLDDPRALLERDLRPSRVVTRDRTVTQEWALRIYREERWAGIRWWSYHDPGAGSFGIWDTGRLRARRVVALDREHPSVVAAAALLRRRWS